MVRIPKIVGDIWFNLPLGRRAPGLQPEDFEGKVILADFWTYSCVNCQRTLPYLRSWWKKYKDENFLIIGIHTPEFEFEKDSKNIEEAIKDLGVTWPVVADNDYVNWNNFANHYWPAKYLADKNGNIVYSHFGEGNYEETEKEIQKLLGMKEDVLTEESAKEHSHGKVCFLPTPELYCGYDRGFLSNEGIGYYDNEIYDYAAPPKIKEDGIALSGKFLARKEYAESQEAGAEVLLNFRATEVNLVLESPNGKSEVEIYLDNKKIKELSIEKSTLFNLLKSNDLTEGILSVRAKKGNFRAYAFTFSGCLPAQAGK